MVSLRRRIIFTLLPLFVIMAAVGGYGAVLIYRIGGRIDQILRENYASVLFMAQLKENLERMDSAFQFALAGHDVDARREFDDNWQRYNHHLAQERANITLPGEAELVSELTATGEHYRRQSAQFFARTDPARRDDEYFGVEGKIGLLEQFEQMKRVANQITALNQANMEQANDEAKRTAQSSLAWFIVSFLAVIMLGGLLARRTISTILRPIESVTQSVEAIGAGNLNQIVPLASSQELGKLVSAVNTMARQLRDYRQTQQARLVRSQQAARATIDSFPDPVVVVDREGKVEMANPAARRIFGLGEQMPTEPMIWQPPTPLREPLTAALQTQRAFLPEGFNQAVPLAIDSGQRFFLPRILPIQDPYGGTLGAAVLLADVTRFQLLDQVKSDLVATVSHELKTPLTSVSMAIHLLLEEVVGPLTPKQLELLLEARSGSERLLAMINNLLDLARLEKGAKHLDIRPEGPAELLQSAADLVRRRAEDQQIALSVNAAIDLPCIAVDARVLSHALKNLLENALTYTDRGGHITMAATRADDSIVVSIADTGSGIAAEFVPHVFDRFFRVPGQSRGSGTGLGLAIAREIVVAHGGSITCTSQLGVGTTFQLTLPVWREATAVPPVAAQAPAA